MKSVKQAQEYSFSDVYKRNLKNDLWIIINGKVYDVTKWIRKHPGGDILLLGIAGQDASMPFVSYHDQKKIDLLIRRFEIGSVKNYKSTKLAKNFEQLRQILVNDGLFNTNWIYYRLIFVWYNFLFIMVWILITSSESWKVLTGGLTLGLFWQQIAFLGHDVGHNSLSKDRRKDWLIAVAVTLFFGVSGAWWKRSHNTHHTFPNSIQWDPDIQHLPFLAVDKRFLNGIYSSYHKKTMQFNFLANLFISYQHLSFFVIMSIARNFMYLQSFLLCLDFNTFVPWRKYELISMTAYWTWMVYLFSHIRSWSLLVLVWLFAHAFCGILHIQITLNHFAMPVHSSTGYDKSGSSDHFILSQLYGTTDISCPKWLDWFHGGLQFQLAHHLFPQVPRHNLRRIRREYLIPFFKNHGLKYNVSGSFFLTLGGVLQKLYDQSKLIRSKKNIYVQEILLNEYMMESFFI